MHYREWKEILNEINSTQDLDSNNIINRIKSTLNRKRPSTYKEWKKKQFYVDHLFLFQDNHIHNKCTLLHISAYCGLENIVKVLLQMGAEVNAIDHMYNKPSLHRATNIVTRNGYTSIADLLARSIGVELMHQSERTPLHFAAKNGHKNTVKTLLENGANVNAIDRDRATPLHYAAKNGHKNTAKTLLENNAKANDKDIDEKTPLHLAVENIHIKVVKVLLKKGANPFLKDQNYHTPRDLARNDSIERLLEKAEKKQRLKPIIITGVVTSIIVACEITLTVLSIKNGYVADSIAFIMTIISTVLALCIFTYHQACIPSTRVHEAHTEERHDAEVSVA